MKVYELVELLSNQLADAEVVLATDEEENHHYPCTGFWVGAYRPDTREVGLATLTDKDREAGYRDEDVIRNGVPAVILR